MFKTVATILKTEDLRNRILFTLAMLAIYRLGIFIPAPGVDRNALSDFKTRDDKRPRALMTNLTQRLRGRKIMSFY